MESQNFFGEICMESQNFAILICWIEPYILIQLFFRKTFFIPKNFYKFGVSYRNLIMLIEQTTTYAYKLKYLENPSFDNVKNLAKKFIDELYNTIFFKTLINNLFIPSKVIIFAQK